MQSLIPLSLILTIFDVVAYAVKLPLHVRTTRQPRSVGRRANTTIPVSNYGNAEYYSNITIAGQEVSVLLDTGSSDLWVNFPDTTPTTTDTGKSLTLSYAIGSASGDIHTASVEFYGYSITSQAFLLVTDTSSFSTDIHSQGYDGLMGLGPNEGSRVLDKLNSDSGDSVLTNIFSQVSNSSKFISFLLDRSGDPGSSITGQLTISEYVEGYENITSMPEIDVEDVHKLLESEQHWQALTDKNNGVIGPDGEVIQTDSIVPKAPDGQLVAVFDSGFTFTQVPRAMSDAIYGRVQGASYDSDNEWWTIPCGQLLNVSFNFGGQNYPVHPLDTVDDNFDIKNANGSRVCIGAFQPITTAFSILGNYDMIMGMNFLRNTYTLMNYGNWVDDNANDPYLQLLSITNVEDAHTDFVNVRLGGSDTTSDTKWDLVSTADMQHSPVSAEEKKKLYEEMILSRWPYILAGCLAFILIIIGLIIWRCCCRRKGVKTANTAKKGLWFRKNKAASTSYLPLQDQGMRDSSTVDVSVPYDPHTGHFGNAGYKAL
ncbi:aspartic peptidase A1 [Guyanagaster necrorhizus]|uniref:Aspartic peptidase A1 n=1 Tax=Guyanagaster necrorhizus TaxID=856835 RepID=A0A9P7VRS0_9AGAR|nr:aspartic peptidase A1 [Guyanagaster necrorhizus MCA 3950]KAG7445719.1 aspartic peptidase A1 [Guyanagaster necrorhizus MCA 3950]